MTLCKDEYCTKEGLVQFTEHTIYKAKVTYWLCEDHWQEKFDQLHTPKPLVLEEPQYDYVEQPKVRKWLRFIPHGCSPTWNFDEQRWDPCPRCGLVRFLHG